MIEGKALDWEAPVEITFGDEPIILTGRNGAGKSLIGKIIELSIESLKGDIKASRARTKLCEENKIQRVVMKLKRPFFAQWCNELSTNLPFFIIHNRHGELGAENPDEVNKHMDIEFSAEHQMMYIWESGRMHANDRFEHRLVTKGYCDGFDEVESNLWGEVILENHIRPGNWKPLVHDIVVELDRFLQKRNMRIIPLDDRIKLITVDEAEVPEITSIEFIEYKKESEMRALLRAFNNEEKLRTKDGDCDESIVWELIHKKPVFQSSSVSSDYFEISAEEGYPNYFRDLNLKFIGVGRKYKSKIDKSDSERKTRNDKFFLDFFESSKLETLTLEDEIKLALQNHGVTLDRRKTQIEEFGLTPKDVKDIIEIVYYDDPNDPYDGKLDHLLCGVGIHEGLDEIRDNWVRASRDPEENEFSFVLHDYIWNRLLGRRNLEQIIAKLEFGINTENLGKILPSGIENLLNLLFEALNAEEGTILFIDEPEISLHIDWQAKIVDVMWKLWKLNHIIFTTHSPEIVMANLDNVITIPPKGA